MSCFSIKKIGHEHHLITAKVKNNHLLLAWDSDAWSHLAKWLHWVSDNYIYLSVRTTPRGVLINNHWIHRNSQVNSSRHEFPRQPITLVLKATRKDVAITGVAKKEQFSWLCKYKIDEFGRVKFTEFYSYPRYNCHVDSWPYSISSHLTAVTSRVPILGGAC